MSARLLLRYLAIPVWPLALIGRGIAAGERIGGLAAAIVTIVAFLPTGALMAIFIR